MPDGLGLVPTETGLEDRAPVNKTQREKLTKIPSKWKGFLWFEAKQRDYSKLITVSHPRVILQVDKCYLPKLMWHGANFLDGSVDGVASTPWLVFSGPSTRRKAEGFPKARFGARIENQVLNWLSELS